MPCVACDQNTATRGCGDCKRLLYCSQACAAAHWETHLIECGYWLENIDQTTRDNASFRRVLYTTSTQQLVVMYLKPGEDVGVEVHPKTTQFVRVVRGSGEAMMGRGLSDLGPGSVVMIPPGTRHNLWADQESGGLWFYTIYSPPEHDANTHQKQKTPDVK